MYVFAWILFGMFIVSFTFRTSILVGKSIALNKGEKVRIDINISRMILDLSVFVFICLFLFGK